MAIERREAYYRGHVQGVGFRFRTCRVATHFAVVGFVENLSDGRVHLIAEGERSELDRFLEEIQQTLGNHIRETMVDRQVATNEFLEFGIRR
ncbi:MAG: acylphosphatase [Planctomycetales bacterium]|nr:acylphosphatase [Planctomycetales bacterium]